MDIVENTNKDKILKEIEIKKALAHQVQDVLKNHNVNHEDLGATVRFLAHNIGAIIFNTLPKNKHKWAIDEVKEDIEYGMEMGIPKD